MRKRMIKTIYNNKFCGENIGSREIDEVVDTLIEAGAFLPKFKIGQIAYWNGLTQVRENEYELPLKTYSGTIEQVRIEENGLVYRINGETFRIWRAWENETYATEAEAQAAISSEVSK